MAYPGDAQYCATRCARNIIKRLLSLSCGCLLPNGNTGKSHFIDDVCTHRERFYVAQPRRASRASEISFQSKNLQRHKSDLWRGYIKCKYEIYIYIYIHVAHSRVALFFFPFFLFLLPPPPSPLPDGKYTSLVSVSHKCKRIVDVNNITRDFYLCNVPRIFHPRNVAFRNFARLKRIAGEKSRIYAYARHLSSGGIMASRDINSHYIRNRC